MKEPNYALKPHDLYFERVFKVRQVALQLMGQIFDAYQRSHLNFDTLELAAESFISQEFQEAFSDLVYICETTEGQKARICLLFEHKSYNPGRRIYAQIGRYLIGIQEEDLVQNRPHFTLTITVLFYHGKEPWGPGPLLSQYGLVPEAFHGFALHFDFILVNLQQKTDEDILAMQDAILLRNVYLAMKHAWEDDFFRRNYEKVFIFADVSTPEEVRLSLFYSTFLYVQMVSSIKKEEIMNMIQSLPPQYERRAKSTYEQIVEEATEKGMEKGMEKGVEILLRNIMLNRPTLSDKDIVELLSIELAVVQKVRQVVLKEQASA